MIRTIRSYWVFMWAVVSLVSSASARSLTKDEAQKLAVAAIDHRLKGLPHFGLDDFPSTEPQEKDFYLFEASYSNPGGPQVVGHYAVHKLTGEVWEFVACRKIESEELHKLQITFRSHIGISPKEAKRLADIAPCD
jgi:hypothetical protein